MLLSCVDARDMLRLFRVPEAALPPGVGCGCGWWWCPCDPNTGGGMYCGNSGDMLGVARRRPPPKLEDVCECGRAGELKSDAMQKSSSLPSPTGCRFTGGTVTDRRCGSGGGATPWPLDGWSGVVVWYDVPCAGAGS